MKPSNLVLISLAVVLLTARPAIARQKRSSAATGTVKANTASNAVSAIEAPAFEDVPIYRLQLRLSTGRTSDAGTDSPVYVQMNSANDTFYLVKGKDNFIQGSVETYEVLIKQVKKIKDIDFIRIGINGNDGVCIKKIELLINNQTTPFFSKEYPGQTGICIDKGSSSLPARFTIPGSELRSYLKWKYTLANKDCWMPPVRISKTWLVSIVEATIGNQIYQEGATLKWGTAGGALENRTLWGDAVEMTRVSDNTVHFDIDLELDRPGPNPEVDIDFDMVLFCNEGNIKTELVNVNIGTDNIGKALDFLSMAPGIGQFLLSAIATIGDRLIGLPHLARNISLGLPITALGLLESVLEFNVKLDVNNPQLSQGCKKIKVEGNGDVKL